MFDGSSIDYETEEYRQLVDIESTPSSYYRIHDNEQSSRLQFLNLADVRGKTCADVGAGAGSFLDLVRGYAAKTIAVEPAGFYHSELKLKGHAVFPYCKDALEELEGRVDFVTCFSVIEHVPNPVEFVSELSKLAGPNATIIISTPNSDDWLIDLLATYKSFFYRVVHKWYFNASSLSFVARAAGLNDVAIQYIQRFPLGNALNWFKEGRPSGNASAGFSNLFEDLYKRELESSGKADYLYMVIRK
jgi:2-polyprenyl-3-methyl-5-hydroxy-6-metoxy-1,4-benzoquinol methylase